MLRYALAIAGAVVMVSNVAFAETGYVEGTSTKVITRSAEPGMASKKVIIHRHDDGFGPSKKVVIKRHDDRYGALVTKKKIIRDGLSGSSMSDGTVIHKRTIIRP